MKRKLTFLSSALFVCLISGCNSYKLVEVSVDTKLESAPEITAARNIRDRLADYKNVVISYSKEYYETIPRDAPQKTTILMNSKGMWITEIEREFLKSGRRVLFRQKYNELLREKGASRSKKSPSLLGADLLVQINSLEYSPNASLSDMTKDVYKIYVSDRKGEKFEVCDKDSEENLPLLQDTEKLIAEEVDNTACMALLDCKVVDARTGELILFYRNQLFKLKSGRKPSLKIQYLFKREDGIWMPIRSFGEPESAGKKKKKGINRGPETQTKIEMVREICSDFVKRINQLRRKELAEINSQ